MLYLLMQNYSFAKTNRPWDDRDRKVIDLLTEQVELMEYSSYDSCI